MLLNNLTSYTMHAIYTANIILSKLDSYFYASYVMHALCICWDSDNLKFQIIENIFHNRKFLDLW